jgi:hypothetical protein
MNICYFISLRKSIVLLSVGFIVNMKWCTMAFTPLVATHQSLLLRYSAPSPSVHRLPMEIHRHVHVSKTVVNSNRDDQEKVKVNIIPDIDPITLTAIGFALIAFNFLVLGNLGDGGIGSLVARIINTYN